VRKHGAVRENRIGELALITLVCIAIRSPTLEPGCAVDAIPWRRTFIPP
jgi:hypothetical protein